MAETYDVYFSRVGDDLELVASAISELEFQIPYPLEYNAVYQWRVDATNVVGTTTGDVWTFTSTLFYPVLPTGVTLDGDGNPTGTALGLNNMMTLKRLVAAANNKVYYET